MIQEIGIQPSCSEATIRIRLDGQDETKINALINKLYLETGNEWFLPNQGESDEWDDDKLVPEYDFSEATVERKNIFGVNVLEIEGDAPYNHGEMITEIIKQYLPKADIEWGE